MDVSSRRFTKAVDGIRYSVVEGKRSNGEIANYPGDSTRDGGRSRELS